MSQEPTSIAVRRFQCRHVFTDGHRCGSPCLRGEEFCYYHHTTRRPRSARPHNPYHEPPNQTTLTLPTPENAGAVQHAIGEIMNSLASNALDPRRAGLLLYALQIASLNLPRQAPAPATQPSATVEEVTLHPTLGTLAPAADFVDPEQLTNGKSTLTRWLEEIEGLDRLDGSADFEQTLTLRACATRTRRQQAPKSKGARPGQDLTPAKNVL